MGIPDKTAAAPDAALRDHFAGLFAQAAYQGFVNDPLIQKSWDAAAAAQVITLPDHMANSAYCFADAMMARRSA